jgi:MFS family permease
MTCYALCRFLAGMSAAFVIPAIYSMMILQYNEESEELIGLANSASVLGVIMGPFIGLALNLLKPYLVPFVGFALFFIVLSVVIMIWVPNTLNKSDIKELKTRYDSRYSFNSLLLDGSQDMNSSARMSNSMSEVIDSFNRQQVEPTYKLFFSYREIIFCFVISCIAIMLVGFE